MSNIVTERRFGTFRVSGTAIWNNPDGLLAALSECLVVRAEQLYATDQVDYTAFSKHFEPIKEGEMARSYSIVERHEDGATVFKFE